MKPTPHNFEFVTKSIITFVFSRVKEAMKLPIAVAKQYSVEMMMMTLLQYTALIKRLSKKDEIGRDLEQKRPRTVNRNKVRKSH